MTSNQSTHTDPDASRPPGSNRRRRTFAVLTVVITLAAIVVVLLGRAALRSHYEETRTYPDATSIPARNGLFVLPPWAPQDATDIEINVQTQGKGRSLRLETATSDLPGTCVATPRPDADPVPGLDLGSVEDARDGYRCGEWFVVRDGATLAAWTAYLAR